MRKAIVMLLVAALITAQSAAAFAAPAASGQTAGSSAGAAAAAEAPKPAPYKAMAYLRTDTTVCMYGNALTFRNANGDLVYPLNFNGSLYLPIRSVSAMMGEPIEWDEYSKTVFIGKTLSNPGKVGVVKADLATDSGIEAASITDTSKGPAAGVTGSGNITAWVKPDVTIMFDFETQTFKDAQDRVVYPINYNGSVYLPIRACSALMGEQIVWDADTKTASIGTAEEKAVRDAKKTMFTDSGNTKVLKRLLTDEAELYEMATAKISTLQSAESQSALVLLSEAVSEDSRRAQQMTVAVKSLDTSDFTDEELAAYAKIAEFAEMTEYYILVMENIAYKAANLEDFSMLAETFMMFAIQTMELLDQAKASVAAIPQKEVEIAA